MPRSADTCEHAGLCLHDPLRALERCPHQDRSCCGHCIFFQAFERDRERGLLGRCRLAELPGFFSCTHEACDEFKARPPRAGQMRSGEREVAAGPADQADPEPSSVPLGAVPPPSRADGVLSAEQWADATGRVLRSELQQCWLPGMRRIHPRFENGEVVLDRPSGEARRLPVKALFRRLCHIKGSLIRMQECIDSQSGFTTQERDALHKHLRGIEGSLTTFNILFRSKGEGFRGTGRRS